MLFMSWAGTSLEGEFISSLDGATRKDIRAIEQRLLTQGVSHHDIRPANVLRDLKTKRLMLIDFERSDVLKGSSVLHEISGDSKRKRLQSLGNEQNLSSPCYMSKWNDRCTTLTSRG